MSCNNDALPQNDCVTINNSHVEQTTEEEKLPLLKLPQQKSWFSRKFGDISGQSLINLGIMFAVLIGYGMGFSLFSPFFPTEADRKGMSATVVGILFGMYQFVMFIGTLLFGKFIETLGLRYMLWAGMLLASTTTMLFGVLEWCPSGVVYIVL